MTLESPHRDRNDRRLKWLWLAYLGIFPAGWLRHAPDPTALLASLAGVLVFLPLYLRGYVADGPRRLAYAAGILAVGCALMHTGGLWSVFPVYAASLAGFTRPTRLGVAGVLVVLALTALSGPILGLSVWEWAPGVFFGAIAGVGGVFIAITIERNEQLMAARDAARRLAVVAERERIARDLHDVLGHTLTLVAVKADLARRLIGRDPAAAEREIGEIHAAARTALADVRAAVTAMRSTTLAAELEGARRALASAEIALETEATAQPMPPLVETAFAFIVREAATNIVRHSGARHCRIRLSADADEATLEVSDDGRGGAFEAGSGITGMRQRLASLGGRLEIDGHAGTRILAHLPLAEVRT
jgi:two-component system sensor histidine kinase DesK